MKLSTKKKISVMTAALTAFALCGCSTETPESAFDNPLPWHDDIAVAPSGSYELLNYSVAVYNTSKGTSESRRVRIADGTMSFELKEQPSGNTTLDMSFSVTYNDAADKADIGLTDTITSTVVFESNSLATSTMQKEVTLADREGKSNLSYKLTADYFGTHKATYIKTAEENAKERTKSLPKDACHDNEMLFFLARAQKIGKGSSTNFKMVNVFDTFNKNSLAQYSMIVSGSDSKRNLDLGDWVKDFGVEAVTDEKTGDVSYPVSCFDMTVSINSEQHGPPYVVMYTENPFKQGDKEHKKIPAFISYSQYSGSNPSRCTEYTLSSCSFTEQ